MSRPPLSPAARRALVAGSINSLGMGFTIPFLLVYLHTVRRIELGVTGLVIATIGGAALSASPLVGTCIDHFGAKRVQLLSLAVSTSGALYLTQVHTAPQAFLAAALLGTGAAAGWPSMNALLAGVSPPEQRSRLFAIEFTLINAGIGVGGIAGGFIADVSRPATFQLLYLIDAASFVLAAAVLLTLRGAGGPVDKPVAADGTRDPGSWRDVLRDRTMRRVCVLFLIVVSAGYAQIESGFPAFATTVAGVSTRVLGVTFAVNTAVIVAGQLLILRRLEGRRRTRAIAGFGVAIALTWTLFGLGGLLGGPSAAALVIASMAVFAVGETLWSPTGNALINDLAPAHLRGRYNALGALMWHVAMMIGPIIASTLLGAGLTWQYIALLLGAALAVLVIAFSLERRLTPEQNGLFPQHAPTGSLPTEKTAAVPS